VHLRLAVSLSKVLLEELTNNKNNNMIKPRDTNHKIGQ
jgi:hypothetical protein